jgi:predicted neuraminidase
MMRFVVNPAVLPLFFVLCVVSVFAAEFPGLITREFIYETTEFPSCHASTLVENAEGRIVAAWFGGLDEGDPSVGIWVSTRDAGGRWSAPVEVANGVQYRRTDGTTLRYPCWNPVLVRNSAGVLYLYYKCGPSPRAWWGMLTRSEDGGKSWSQPCRLPEGILGPVRNKPIYLPGGALLCGSSTEHDGWRVHFELTPDDGRSWTLVGPIDSGVERGAIQPTLLPHSDGRIQALCRDQNGQGHILESWSEDQGRSWSALQRLSLPNPNSGIDGVSLADGRFLLVYNHTVRGGKSPQGREMLNLAISPNGSDWQAVAELENSVGGEFSYPAVIQTADGRVHITYTWHRERIRYLVVDPAKLTSLGPADEVWGRSGE